MLNVTAGTRVLIVAAHPDDEILGCGATAAKWVDAGAEVHALILAEGLTSRVEDPDEIPEAEKERLRGDARRSAAIIGFKTLEFERFPDNRMDTVALLDVIHKVLEHVARVQPEIILTHHAGDLNVDHRAAFEAVITACRPQSGNSVKTIATFETPSSTEWNFPYRSNGFSPNVFVDVTATLQRKLDAMACYTGEIRDEPHPRSLGMLEAIAKRWGSVADRAFVEAFELIRTVD